MIFDKMKIEYDVHAYVVSSRQGSSVSLSGKKPLPHQGIEQFKAGLSDLEIKLDQEKSSQVYPQAKTEMPLDGSPQVTSNPISYTLVKAYDLRRDFEFDLTMTVSGFSKDLTHKAFNQNRCAGQRRGSYALGVRCRMEFEGSYEQAAILEKIKDVFLDSYEGRHTPIREAQREKEAVAEEEKQE